MTAATPGRRRSWLTAAVVMVVCVVLARVVGRALHLGDFWVALCFPGFVVFMARTYGWGLWSSVAPLVAVTFVYVLGR